MTGGPSHIDTFDLKPDAPANYRGEFEAIDTSAPGIRISEHFPKLARRMQHAAVIRSMTTPESDHQLASYHVHTGYQQRAGGLAFPALGALASAELGRADSALPNYVVVGPDARWGTSSGFLGQRHQPLYVNDPVRGVEYVQPLVDDRRFDRQLDLLRKLEQSFYRRYQAPASQAHAIALDASERLMRAPELGAFDLSREPNRDAYGDSDFARGCLLARRLVEAGIPFVEVNMRQADWDTHKSNFPRTKSLSLDVDQAMGALLDDLHDRGLLERTLLIWMGEFGRSPQISSDGGRNHHPKAWSSLLIGGGVKGGQVIGRTDRTATEVVDRPVRVVDFLATVCQLMGIDYAKENHPPGVNRPIRIVDKDEKPILELLS
jgi:arylsulfatase A-like enzyme